jgi:hypothetical protein
MLPRRDHHDEGASSSTGSQPVCTALSVRCPSVPNSSAGTPSATISPRAGKHAYVANPTPGPTMRQPTLECGGSPPPLQSDEKAGIAWGLKRAVRKGAELFRVVGNCGHGP